MRLGHETKSGDDSQPHEMEGPDTWGPSPVPVFAGPWQASSLPCCVCGKVDTDGNYWVRSGEGWLAVCETHFLDPAGLVLHEAKGETDGN